MRLLNTLTAVFEIDRNDVMIFFFEMTDVSLVTATLYTSSKGQPTQRRGTSCRMVQTRGKA